MARFGLHAASSLIWGGGGGGGGKGAFLFHFILSKIVAKFELFKLLDKLIATETTVSAVLYTNPCGPTAEKLTIHQCIFEGPRFRLIAASCLF